MSGPNRPSSWAGKPDESATDKDRERLRNLNGYEDSSLRLHLNDFEVRFIRENGEKLRLSGLRWFSSSQREMLSKIYHKFHAIVPA